MNAERSRNLSMQLVATAGAPRLLGSTHPPKVSPAGQQLEAPGIPSSVILSNLRVIRRLEKRPDCSKTQQSLARRAPTCREIGMGGAVLIAHSNNLEKMTMESLGLLSIERGLRSPTRRSRPAWLTP
jgi:hypothetical protein